MDTSRFDYELPEELIAQHPLPEREASRLLVLDRARREFRDATVEALPDLLDPGDLLVMNNTRVVPARLRATRESSGGQVEILLLPPDPEEGNRPIQASDVALTTLRRGLTRSGGKLRDGEVLMLPGGVQVTILERHGLNGDTLEFALPEHAFAAYLEQYGEVPLPPYIQRGPGPSAQTDRQRYQTVYARRNGAVAAPTAGLHFSPGLFVRLEERGIERAEITLHVGPGTFRPVKAEKVEDHRLDPEPYQIDPEAASKINRAMREKRRIVAIGTTSVRTLESRWDASALRLMAGSGRADLYLYPPCLFHVVGAMMTNFHLPKSSLLMLVSAFASPGDERGIEFVMAAYEHAKRAGYRFYSYGDACLIL